MNFRLDEICVPLAHVVNAQSICKLVCPRAHALVYFLVQVGISKCS